MSGTIICCPITTPAIAAADAHLSQLGFSIISEPHPNAKHILLPVPSFPVCEAFVRSLNENSEHDTIISGGNLVHPVLSDFPTVDFLQDPYYLAENAAITARCAKDLLIQRITAPFPSKKVLILGWGRIGKCLAKELQQAGFSVTIAARRDTSCAMAHALGFSSISISDVPGNHRTFDVIVNTIPAMVLPDPDTKPDTIVMELASCPGIAGENVISARGLPGKYAPEESGKLIAETFIRLSLGKEVKP